MVLSGKQNQALTSHYLEANRIISSEFSYLFPHTFHQSACHPLQINTRKKNSSESEKHWGGKNLTDLTKLNSDIRKKIFEAQISFRHL